MAYKRKTRVISFRLSEEQYLALREISLSQGARSVSDYARDNLLRQLEPGPTSGEPRGIEDRINRLTGEIEELNRIVERLCTAVDRPEPVEVAE